MVYLDVAVTEESMDRCVRSRIKGAKKNNNKRGHRQAKPSKDSKTKQRQKKEREREMQAIALELKLATGAVDSFDTCSWWIRRFCPSCKIGRCIR
jgi:hypothetical protein